MKIARCFGKMSRIDILSLLCTFLLLSTIELHAEALVVKEVENDLKNLSTGQEPVSKSLNLYGAMARAIKYNREHRLKKMQTALAMEQKDKSYFDFLPELSISAGYTGRNNENASSSESYFTGQETLEPSISEDRDRGTGDIALTWSAIDFGIAYARSKQHENRFFIAREAERKAVQNIISDVRKAWWNAISAQRLLLKIDPFVTEVETALADSREIERKRLESPLKALTYQRSLIDMLRTLENLRNKLNKSKQKLIALMGMDYSQDIVLEDAGSRPELTGMTWNTEMMEKVALISRPELMQSRYQDRITREETRIAILGLVPDLNLNAGWNWDTNSYLINNSWFDYGIRVSWNLMKLFSTPAELRTAETDEEVAKQQRMAIAMTVLMQVHFAKANYLQRERQYNIENLALSVENRILQQVLSGNTTRKLGSQVLIREQLNQLIAEIRNDSAYAELQDSFGRILVTLGINTIPVNIEEMSVSDLADFLETSMESLRKMPLQEATALDLYLPQADPSA